MTHMEYHDLCISGIDRVKNEIRIADSWEHADAGLVGKMTSLRKVLEQASDRFDALDHSSCRRAIAFVDVGKYAVDVVKRAFRPAHPHAL